MSLEPPIQILYVCTGNICRSPFAAAAARAYAERVGLPVKVCSASTLGLSGEPPDRKMARVAFQAGVPISGTSTPLTAELLEWADHVLVMEIRHAEAVRRIAAEANIKDPNLALLGPFAGVQEISDPHGSWTYGPYRRARLLIQRAVVAHLEHLAATLKL